MVEKSTALPELNNTEAYNHISCINGCMMQVVCIFKNLVLVYIISLYKMRYTIVNTHL